MKPNAPLMKATLTGALGGLLFGFDTVVIAGAIDALVSLYHLNPQDKGLTVAIGLVGTVVGALGAGVVGQKLGGRETLRITAVLYLASAIGCGFAWNWPSFMFFRSPASASDAFRSAHRTESPSCDSVTPVFRSAEATDVTNSTGERRSMLPARISEDAAPMVDDRTT